MNQHLHVIHSTEAFLGMLQDNIELKRPLLLVQHQGKLGKHDKALARQFLSFVHPGGVISFTPEELDTENEAIHALVKELSVHKFIHITKGRAPVPAGVSDGR